MKAPQLLVFAVLSWLPSQPHASISQYSVVSTHCMNEHFAAVWVGDRGPMLENLVCGPNGQRNLMRASNVSWTSEGARMDGVTSRLWVDDTEGIDFTNSYTWILHLKRTPRDNCLIEVSDCVNFGKLAHLFEYSINGDPGAILLNPGLPGIYQSGSVLPSDPEQFFIVGVSFEGAKSSIRIFYGSSFLQSKLTLFPADNDFPMPGFCIKIGWRATNYAVLNGAIRAVAFAKPALPENAIQRLFHVG